MTPLHFTVIMFAVSISAGVLGSLLGIGGGIIVVPVLTQLFGIDMHHAVGASIVSVIATSSGAAAAYVRERMTNLRVAMLLEIGTTTGALTGAVVAGYLNARVLQAIFGVILAASALMMLRKRREKSGLDVKPDVLSEKLRLHGSYFDEKEQREVAYRVTNAPLGLGLMYVAGVLSGLLGIGSGVLKVPAMDLAMRLPIKVSTATSNFMIGVTAATGAGVYFARGDINPFIAGPVAGGVLIGATIGSRLLGKLTNKSIRVGFIVILLWASFEMLRKGVFG
ncbi:MAG: sulfite exporter TauE/SafE family protein [Tepidisphaeraceae bacterium]